LVVLVVIKRLRDQQNLAEAIASNPKSLAETDTYRASRGPSCCNMRG
jgi:hypothetical protein